MLNKAVNNLNINIWWKLLWDIYDDVNFNWYSLSSFCKNWSEWIAVINNPIAGMSDIELSEFINWQEDGWWIISRRYSWRIIYLQIQITGIDYNDLLRRIDDLKKNLSWIEWELSFKFWETSRVTKASLKSWDAENLVYWENDVDITLWFRILSPHFYLRKSTWYLFEDITSLEYSDIIDNKWTWKARPKIILVFKETWNNNISKIEIILKKLWEAEWYSVILEKSIVNSDLVIFDFKKSDISINWIWKQKFDGIMDELQPDLNVLDINITWDNVNYEVSIIYNEIYK